MDLGAVFLLLATLLLIGLFISSPFVDRHRMTVVSAEEQELSSLLAERDRLLSALQDLDFDHTLGKIPDNDYPRMRADLMQQAANVLRRLDTFQPQAASDADVESRIEAVIAARRVDAAAQHKDDAPLSDDDFEALIAARRAAQKEKTGGFCPKCGKPVLRSDHFCPHCGNPIK